MKRPSPSLPARRKLTQLKTGTSSVTNATPGMKCKTTSPSTIDAMETRVSLHVSENSFIHHSLVSYKLQYLATIKDNINLSAKICDRVKMLGGGSEIDACLLAVRFEWLLPLKQGNLHNFAFVISAKEVHKIFSRFGTVQDVKILPGGTIYGGQ